MEFFRLPRPSTEFETLPVAPRRTIEADRRFSLLYYLRQRILIRCDAQKAAARKFKVIPLAGRLARLGEAFLDVWYCDLIDVLAGDDAVQRTPSQTSPAT